jgi:hypothetical protein
MRFSETRRQNLHTSPGTIKARGRTTEESWFDSQQEQYIFSSKESTLVLMPILLAAQWVTEAFPWK